MSAIEGPVERWERLSETLRAVFSVHEDQALVLAVGKGDESRAGLAGLLTEVLPAGLRLREFVFQPDNLNPFVDFQRGVDRGQYVTLASGLSTLSAADQKKALELLNWSRGLLERGGIKLVLWVEPELVPTLYRYAGDFADWWTALVEVPERPPPRRAPSKGKGEWGVDDHKPGVEDPRRALERLLLELFTPEELSALIRRHVAEWSEILPVPAGIVSHAAFMFHIVRELEIRGLLDGSFFVALQRARPSRAEEIASVAALMGIQVGPTSDPRSPSPTIARSWLGSLSPARSAALLLALTLAALTGLRAASLLRAHELRTALAAPPSAATLRVLSRTLDQDDPEQLALLLGIRGEGALSPGTRDALLGLAPLGLAPEERVRLLPPLILALAPGVEEAPEPESLYGALLSAAELAGSEVAMQAVVDQMRMARGAPPTLDPRDGSWSARIAGKFQIGCFPETGDVCAADETLHEVTLSPYRIRKREESLGQYRRFDPDHLTRELLPDTWPLFEVNAYEAQAYAAWLGASLPTEAQWEVAARGGCENCDPSDYRKTAWYAGKSQEDLLRVGLCVGDRDPFWQMMGSPRPLSVERLMEGPPHPLGLQHVHGTMSEWTRDLYGPYPTPPLSDAQSPEAGADLLSLTRVVRGGSWGGSPTLCRSAARAKEPPSLRSDHIGLRLVLPEPPG